MAKDDLHLVRVLQLGDEGKDVVAVKRALSHARVGFPMPVRHGGKFNDRFGPKLEAGIKRFQRKHGLVDDGKVAYLTFKALVRHVDAFGSKLLRDFAKAQVGDWGLIGRRSAFNGIDMGVDFKGKGPIPMFNDGKIVRIVRSGSGWPGEGGLIVVECDRGPMAKHPIYTAEDIAIPASHKVGKRLRKGELLATATGSNKAPGIELGWAGKGPAFFGTLFHEKHGNYTMNPRATAEGLDFWRTLDAWMAKGM
jgi:Putative peptidoglycan binding domain